MRDNTQDTPIIEEITTTQELELLRIELWGVTSKAMTLPFYQMTAATAAEEVEGLKISVQLGMLNRALARRGITPAPAESIKEIEAHVKDLQSKFN